MKIIKDFWAFYVTSPFRRDTLEDKIIIATERATLEVMQREYTIRSEQFALHMAKAEIKAMEIWNHQGAPK